MAWNTKYAISTNIKGRPMLYAGPIIGFTATHYEAMMFDSWDEADDYILDHWSNTQDYEVVDFDPMDV